MGPIREHLGQARGVLQSQAGDRPVLAARVELLQNQAGELQRRRGNWDHFRRLYQETLAIFAAQDLPPDARNHWDQVVRLMAEAGVGPEGTPSRPQQGSAQPQPEQLQEALAMVRVLQANLPAAPSGAARQSYLQAREQLQRLGNLLQLSLQESRQGKLPGRYSELLVERARFYLLRDDLRAPGDFLRPLDDALKQLP